MSGVADTFNRLDNLCGSSTVFVRIRNQTN